MTRARTRSAVEAREARDLRLGEPVRPAFYASDGGSVAGDLVTLLHAPYTAWHLAYVVLGAAIAPGLDGLRLAGTLAAFFLGTGIASHALDELHGRPLRTRLSDGALIALGVGGLAGAVGVAVLGAFVISPWVLAWAAGGIVLAAGYPLERPRWLHSDAGFAVAWGGFPVLAGYWAQAETLAPAAVAMAVAAVLLSLAQRALSTPARFTRRHTLDATIAFDLDGNAAHSDARWDRERLLATWERPLALLALAVVVLAAALLVARM